MVAKENRKIAMVAKGNLKFPFIFEYLLSRNEQTIWLLLIKNHKRT